MDTLKEVGRQALSVALVETGRGRSSVDNKLADAVTLAVLRELNAAPALAVSKFHRVFDAVGEAGKLLVEIGKIVDDMANAIPDNPKSPSEPPQTPEPPKKEIRTEWTGGCAFEYEVEVPVSALAAARAALTHVKDQMRSRMTPFAAYAQAEGILDNALAHLTEQETLMKTDTEGCTCRHCAPGRLHASDCAVHNGPALPVGPCDCGIDPPLTTFTEQEQTDGEDRDRPAVIADVDGPDGVWPVGAVRASGDSVAGVTGRRDADRNTDRGVAAEHILTQPVALSPEVETLLKEADGANVAAFLLEPLARQLIHRLSAALRASETAKQQVERTVMALADRIELLETAKQQDKANEEAAARQLSDILSGGNASTWEHIFHAAEALKAAKQQAEQGEAKWRDIANDRAARIAQAEASLAQREAEIARLTKDGAGLIHQAIPDMAGTEPRPVCMYRGCEVPPEPSSKFCAFHPFILDPELHR